MASRPEDRVVWLVGIVAMLCGHFVKGVTGFGSAQLAYLREARDVIAGAVAGIPGLSMCRVEATSPGGHHRRTLPAEVVAVEVAAAGVGEASERVEGCRGEEVEGLFRGEAGVSERDGVEEADILGVEIGVLWEWLIDRHGRLSAACSWARFVFNCSGEVGLCPLWIRSIRAIRLVESLIDWEVSDADCVCELCGAS